MRSMLTHMGIPVYESRYLPLRPSPAAEARQIVREGLSDVLKWLGQEVGTEGRPVHIIAHENALFASAEGMESLRRELVRKTPLIHRRKGIDA